MDYSPRQWIVGAAIFLLAGLGLMKLVVVTSEIRSDACEEYCTAQGKNSISLPAGTMGQTVESGSTGDWRTDSQTCRCSTLKSVHKADK